jgi:hypothetical protein
LFLLKLVFLTKYLLLQGSLYLIVGELPFICKILKGTHLMLSKLLLRLPKLVPLLMTSVLWRWVAIFNIHFNCVFGSNLNLNIIIYFFCFTAQFSIIKI